MSVLIMKNDYSFISLLESFTNDVQQLSFEALSEKFVFC